ncbi:MAG: VOC family protein [Geothermobacteraceae bacterium]
METGLGLVLTLAVDDLVKTAHFYREILGLKLHRIEPGRGFPALLLLRRGDAAILFRGTEHLEASHPALFEHIERHPRGVGVTIDLEVPDLERVVRAIDRHGLHLLYELDDQEHGRREIWLHDPDGYLLVLGSSKEKD